MRGHIAKKGNRYYVVIELDADGKGTRRRKWHSGFRTRKEARAALARLQTDQQDGTYIEPSKVTVAEYFEGWLPKIKTTVRPSTWTSYESNIRLHVIPRIGALRLRDLTPSRLDGLYAELLEDRDGQRGLSAKTVHNVHTILHRALKDAVRKGQLSRNVSDAADLPKRTSSPQMRVWTAEELRRFLELVAEDRLFATYFLAATTGMRRGELLGLRWPDVELEEARLSVRQSLVSVGYVMRVSEPKTDRSKRTIDIDPATVDTLRAHRVRQLEERFAWGPAWTDSGLVFTREDGSPIHPQSLSDAFERYVKNSNLPKIRLHDLRHTYATLALASGMKPWDVSDRLGHSSVAFTLNVYRHAIRSTQKDAADLAASFILGSTGDSRTDR